MLVDFMTFFDTVHAKQVDAALSVIEKKCSNKLTCFVTISNTIDVFRLYPGSK
jgi:hypothetical protein